jgi:hypothetical protein
VRAIVQQVIAERAAALSAWFSSLDPNDDDGTGLLSSSTLALTREEVETLTADLNGMLTKLADDIRDRTPPADAHRYRVHVDVFPLDGAAHH